MNKRNVLHYLKPQKHFNSTSALFHFLQFSQSIPLKAAICEMTHITRKLWCPPLSEETRKCVRINSCLHTSLEEQGSTSNFMPLLTKSCLKRLKAMLMLTFVSLPFPTAKCGFLAGAGGGGYSGRLPRASAIVFTQHYSESLSPLQVQSGLTRKDRLGLAG